MMGQLGFQIIHRYQFCILQMLAPEHQESYDDVIAQRTAAMSDRTHDLFFLIPGTFLISEVSLYQIHIQDHIGTLYNWAGADEVVHSSLPPYWKQYICAQGRSRRKSEEICVSHYLDIHTQYYTRHIRYSQYCTIILLQLYHNGTGTHACLAQHNISVTRI